MLWSSWPPGRLEREKKNNNKAESFTQLYLNNVSVDVDNRERARDRFEKQRRRISLETQAENFKVR